ncbi:MAG: DUF1289 domain-containing protein [Coraliomargarita sp.]
MFLSTSNEQSLHFVDFGHSTPLMSDNSLASSSPASPCTDDCVLNAEKICTGCYRHIDEIAGWGRKPDAEKRDILENCARREAELGQQ